ncbi:MAG: hypothetical protein J3R72DRAFT_525197 [Linnemannia gamsii]|nr:MAG: hypothetical protein J3R72DRAFT_525197 [Linnemannia gamsii]
MSNISDKVSNTYNSTMGGAKQTLGETLGNTNLAASGAQQKAQADAAQKAADAKTHAEGLGHKAKGEVQQNVGSMTGNTGMEARGHANEMKANSCKLATSLYPDHDLTMMNTYINVVPNGPLGITYLTEGYRTRGTDLLLCV